LSLAATALKQAAKLAEERDKLRAEYESAREKFDAQQSKRTSKIAKLDQEIGRLVGTQSGGTLSPRNGPTRGRRGSIDREAIVSFVAAQRSPVGATDIGRGTETTASSAALSNALKALVDAGTLKKAGQRRGTKYSLA
jgi:hypothetical protein